MSSAPHLPPPLSDFDTAFELAASKLRIDIGLMDETEARHFLDEATALDVIGHLSDIAREARILARRRIEQITGTTDH